MLNETQQHKLYHRGRLKGRSSLLLTRFTFTRHRLSPFAVLLPVRTFFTITFFTMRGAKSYFVKFTVPTLKGIFEGL